MSNGTSYILQREQHAQGEGGGEGVDDATPSSFGGSLTMARCTPTLPCLCTLGNKPSRIVFHHTPPARQIYPHRRYISHTELQNHGLRCSGHDLISIHGSTHGTYIHNGIALDNFHSRRPISTNARQKAGGSTRNLVIDVPCHPCTPVHEELPWLSFSRSCATTTPPTLGSIRRPVAVGGLRIYVRYDKQSLHRLHTSPLCCDRDKSSSRVPLPWPCPCRPLGFAQACSPDSQRAGISKRLSYSRHTACMYLSYTPVHAQPFCNGNGRGAKGPETTADTWASV